LPRRVDPEEQPTLPDSSTEITTDDSGTAIGTGVALRTRTATAQAMATPIKPPLAASIEDSTRNWLRCPVCGRHRLADADLMVRSVTTASMMFMITTPPTTMNTETTATAVAAMAPVNWSTPG